MHRFAPCALLTACQALLWLLAGPAAAQVTPDTTGAGDALESLLEEPDEDTGNHAQLAELLAAWQENPLDVNEAPADLLAQIPSLGPVLARAVARHRAATGGFSALTDLLAVEGMTEDILLAIRPYLTLGGTGTRLAPSPRLGRLAGRLRFDLLQRVGRRLDLGRGYDGDTTRSTYDGSPVRLYTRLRGRSGRQLSLNLTLEKDPGERFAWDPSTRTYGYDHVTAHAALRDVGRLKAFIVGDYVADFGQGVVLWRNSAPGKGREPVRPLARRGRGLAPYGSTEENRFFRGVAATLLLTPALSASAFASRRSLDAAVTAPDATDDALEDLGEATGLARSGLHRTPAERSRKDAVREHLLGGNVAFSLGAARAGVVGYHSRFDHAFRPGGEPYQRFLFAGTRASMAGAYADAILGRAHLFGEVARAPGGAVGGVGGLSMRLADRAETLFLLRHFPRDFVSLHGFAFGERNGATQNETGYYLGLQLYLDPRWRVAAYFDQYRFPWLRFGVPRPSTGYDVRLLVEYRPRRWLSVYLQGRSETKETGTAWRDGPGRALDAVHAETRQSLRVHGDYLFGPGLRLRARVEGVRFAAPGARDAYGLVLYQDVRWLPLKTLQCDLRLALFDVDRFDARVFTYEDDLRYTFSVPAFSGRGQRAYVLMRWQASNRLLLEAKAAATRFEDVQTVGSGLDEVRGNQIREVRAQMLWRF